MGQNQFIMSTTAPNDPTALPGADPFVSWFRQVAPHIHAYRGKTFVLAMVGELIAAGRLPSFAQDLSVLAAMGIRIVLIHGFRPQVNEQLQVKGHPSIFHRGLRITDATALDCAQEAAGQLRFEIEAALSQGLPNTPMANATLRVVSGNFLTARPIGIVDGVDHLHSGVVRKVDSAGIRGVLDLGAIVLLSPFGFSPTGEAFNLAMEDVATSVAVAIAADKLMFICEVEGVREATAEGPGGVDTELSLAEAKKWLSLQAEPVSPLEPAHYLRHCVAACEAGVERSHILPYWVDGVLFHEIYTHDGVGSMVVDERLESLREAVPDDIGGILQLIEPLERDGVLVRRSRTEIERDIAHYTVVAHDGVIFGCAALYPYASAGTGELAALTVSPAVQGHGDGEKILRRIEQRARASGLKSIFVLTTRTMHWFIKRGFVQVDPDWLPEDRKRKYNWDRRSQVLVKTL